MSSYVPAGLRKMVAERAEGHCEYCLIHEEDTFVGCQIEHIVSHKHGGQTVESNLALACAFCNRFKGTDIATLTPGGQLVRLFNPRIDQWSDHFVLRGILIEGITEIGMATVHLLGFNQADRLIEREELAAVGRFPSEVAKRRMKTA